jgi:hypothetical protein
LIAMEEPVMLFALVRLVVLRAKEPLAVIFPAVLIAPDVVKVMFVPVEVAMETLLVAVSLTLTLPFAFALSVPAEAVKVPLLPMLPEFDVKLIWAALRPPDKLLLFIFASQTRLMVPLLVPSIPDDRLNEAPLWVAVNVTPFALITPLFAKVVALGAAKMKVPVVVLALDAAIVTLLAALSVMLMLPLAALALTVFAESTSAPLLPILPEFDVRFT